MQCTENLPVIALVVGRLSQVPGVSVYAAVFQVSALLSEQLVFAEESAYPCKLRVTVPVCWQPQHSQGGFQCSNWIIVS